MLKSLFDIQKRWNPVDALKVTISRFLLKFDFKVFDEIGSEDIEYFHFTFKSGYEIRRKFGLLGIERGDWNIKRILIRPFTSDLSVFKQIFVDNEFKELIALIGNEKIGTIIDCGANIGISSVKFHSVFPNAFIVPIEPDSGNFRILLRNLAENSVHAAPMQTGVWNKNTKLYFDRSFRDGKEWSIAVTEVPNNGESIESVSINSIVLRLNIKVIHLLKIDIEGSEKNVFSLNDSSLDFLDITRFIAIELHHEFEVEQSIRRLLSERGFKLLKSGVEYLIGRNENLLPSFD